MRAMKGWDETVARQLNEGGRTLGGDYLLAASVCHAQLSLRMSNARLTILPNSSSFRRLFYR